MTKIPWSTQQRLKDAFEQPALDLDLTQVHQDPFNDFYKTEILEQVGLGTVHPVVQASLWIYAVENGYFGWNWRTLPVHGRVVAMWKE